MPRSANFSAVIASAFCHNQSEPTLGIDHFLPRNHLRRAAPAQHRHRLAIQNQRNPLDASELRDLVTRRAIVSCIQRFVVFFLCSYEIARSALLVSLTRGLTI